MNGAFTGVKPEAPLRLCVSVLCLRLHATRRGLSISMQTVEAFGDLSDVYMPVKVDGDTVMWEAGGSLCSVSIE